MSEFTNIHYLILGAIYCGFLVIWWGIPFLLMQPKQIVNSGRSIKSSLIMRFFVSVLIIWLIQLLYWQLIAFPAAEFVEGQRGNYQFDNVPEGLVFMFFGWLYPLLFSWPVPLCVFLYLRKRQKPNE